MEKNLGLQSNTTVQLLMNVFPVAKSVLKACLRLEKFASTSRSHAHKNHCDMNLPRFAHNLLIREKKALNEIEFWRTLPNGGNNGVP